MAKSKEAFTKAWAQIVARTWVDEEFKKKLLKNPEKVLKEMGIAVPSGVKLELHQQSEKKLHLILPQMPEMELSEKELKKFYAGKGCLKGDCGGNCGGGSCW